MGGCLFSSQTGFDSENEGYKHLLCCEGIEQDVYPKSGKLCHSSDSVGREGSCGDGGARCSDQNGSSLHYEAALLLSSQRYIAAVDLQDSQALYFVMSLCRGGSFWDLIKYHFSMLSIAERCAFPDVAVILLSFGFTWQKSFCSELTNVDH